MAGEAQVGSAVGTAVGSIWGPAGAAVGGAIGGAVGGMAAAPSQGGAAGGGPMFTTASSSTYGTTIGNDNWIVNFGGANTNTPVATKTTTTRTDDRQTLGQAPDPYYDDTGAGGGFGISAGGNGGLLLLGVGALVLFKLMRRRHG